MSITNKDKNSYIMLIIGAYYTMFMLGFFLSMRGFLLPQIVDYFNINYTVSSLIFLLPFLTGVIGNIFSGYLYSFFNKKIVLLIALLIAFIFYFLIPFSMTFSMFTLFILLMNAGYIPSSTGSHIAVTDVYSYKYKKFLKTGIHLTHFFYSVGAIIFLQFGNSIVKIVNNLVRHQSLIKSGTIPNWKILYLSGAILWGLILIIYAFSKYPQKIYSEKNNQQINLKQAIKLLTTPRMIFYSLAIMFYIGVEAGIINWSATFLQTGFGRSEIYSSNILKWFFIFFTIGRFGGIFIIHKIDKKIILFSLLFFEILILIAAFLFKIKINNFDIFIPLSGFLLSVIYPIIQNMMIKDFYRQASAATGIFLAFSVAGTTFPMFLIGLINDLVGVRYGILLIIIYAILMIPLLIMTNIFKLKDNLVVE